MMISYDDASKIDRNFLALVVIQLAAGWTVYLINMCIVAGRFTREYTVFYFTRIFGSASLTRHYINYL